MLMKSNYWAVFAGILAAISLGACDIDISMDYGEKNAYAKLKNGEVIKPGGETITEKRELAVYRAIELYGGFDLELVESGTHSAELEGDQNFVKLIETRVEHGRLIIDNRHIRRSRNMNVEIKLSFAQLDKLHIRGAGDVEGENLETTEFEISVQGAGDVRLEDLKNSKTIVDIAGAGDVKLSGETEHVEVLIKGAGDVQLRELRSKTAVIKVFGAGDVGLCASEKVTKKIGGAGDVRNYCEE